MRHGMNTTRVIGYAREANTERPIEIQIKRLRAAGCDTVYSEVGSGMNRRLPEMSKMLADLRSGDVVVVTDVSRLSRSLAGLSAIMERAETVGATVRQVDGRPVSLLTTLIQQ